MIFDTLAAMADWLNDRKFDDSATPQEVKEVIDDLERSTSSRNAIDPITRGGAMEFSGDEAKHAARVFASAMQNRAPRSVIEAAMGSSSSSSLSSSSSSSSSESSSYSSSSSSSSVASTDYFGHPAIAAFDSFLSNAYHLEEDATADRVDAHGTNDMTVPNGSPQQIDGVNNNAASVDYTDGLLQSANWGVTGNNAWSISLWIRPEATSERYFLYYDNLILAFGFLDRDQKEILQYFLGTWVTIHTVDYATEAWMHLVLTCNGTTLKGYVDGVECVSNPETPAFSNSQLQLGFVGAPPIAGPYFDIDELSLWNGAAIDFDAVTALYNGGAGRFYSP